MEYASVDWYKSSASKQYLKREKMINDHAKIQTDHLNKIKRNKLLQSINPVRELKSDYFDSILSADRAAVLDRPNECTGKRK